MATPKQVRRRGRLSLILGAIMAAVLFATVAFGADIQTDADLSTNVLAPTEVQIGSNPFQIKVWATGNLNNASATGTATVVNKYLMATNGTITPSAAAGDKTTLTFTKEVNYSQDPPCGATAATSIQGCANNPFVVNATLEVAAGTADGTAGVLTVSNQGSLGLQADGTPDTGRVAVEASDADGDGVPDDEDNCPNVANSNQADADSDGIGNACEPDSDGDTVIDDNDNCPSVANSNQADADSDGIGNACEPDSDGDTVIDDNDNCPSISNLGQDDADGDGIGNPCDPNAFAPAAGSVNSSGASGDEGAPLSASGNFTDGDGNGTVTITKQSGAGNVTQGANGTWSWSFTSPDQDSGSVTLEADDGPHAVATQTFNWVAANAAPTAPGKPNLAIGTTPNNSGQFKLDWAGSSDVAADTVSYGLEHKDANDAAYSVVASGLSSNEYTFTAATPEGEGTWTYRANASDEDGGTSSYSPISDPVKVDKSNPNAPSPSVGTPDYTGGGGWYKDTVTVSFTGNGDPNLQDGSAGSGVNAATVGPDDSFNTSGSHTASDTVLDNAGNESAAGSLTVQVDATAPTLDITCPPSPVILGSSASASWTASDNHSGLATPDSGSVTLDTSSVGSKTAFAPDAYDNVGHKTSDSCTYSVAYDFVGFFQPVDNKMLNGMKAGSTAPIKWQLKDAAGNYISSLAAIKTVASGVMPCATSAPVDNLEEYATGGTALRYDSVANQYIYNWQSPKKPGTCYQVKIVFADNSERIAAFQLK